MSDKLIKYLAIFYCVFLVLSFFYVRSILNSNPVDVLTRDVPKTVEEVKPVTVTLVVEKDGTSKSAKYDLRNIDSPADLLRKGRDMNQLYFEFINYSDKTVINVDNKETLPNQAWHMFYNNGDITDIVNKGNLVDGGIYTLKLVTRNAMPQ